MGDLDAIKAKINTLKQEIDKKILEYNEINNDDILILSKRLDSLINQWYRINTLK